MSDPGAERPRRLRRSTQQVRRALLESATEEFRNQGYAGTTIRSVAARAETSLSVFHRHFGSKEELFAQAFAMPFAGFLDAFAATWRTQRDEPWDEERLTHQLVGDLYRTLDDHRLVLEGLVAAMAGAPSPLADALRAEIARVLGDFDRIGDHESTARPGLSTAAAHSAERLVIALAVGAVLTQDWLPSPAETDRPASSERDATIALLTRFTLYGVRQSPPPS